MIRLFPNFAHNESYSTPGHSFLIEKKNRNRSEGVKMTDGRGGSTKLQNKIHFYQSESESSELINVHLNITVDNIQIMSRA